MECEPYLDDENVQEQEGDPQGSENLVLHAGLAFILPGIARHPCRCWLYCLVCSSVSLRADKSCYPCGLKLSSSIVQATVGNLKLDGVAFHQREQ